jgi:hypothetical protein
MDERRAIAMAQDYVVLVFANDVVVGEDAEGSLVNCLDASGRSYLTLRSAKAVARAARRFVAAPVAVVGADDNLVAYVA